MPVGARRLGLLLTFSVLASAASTLPSPLAAQDAHYWTFQYGPRASLLGGAVIGSVEDISGTFYNPGALALADRLSFALAVNVFEYERVTAEDAGGEGVDLTDDNLGAIPNIVAGTFTRNLWGGTLAYSIITRFSSDTDVSSSTEVPLGSAPPETGIDFFAAGVRFESGITETWGGVTYAHSLGERFGVGGTLYGSFRTQRRRTEVLAELLQTDGEAALLTQIERFSIKSARLLMKFGAFADFGNLTAGVSLTTPSVQVAGWGDATFTDSQVGLGEPEIATSFQDELDAKVKNPVSIGLGAAYGFGRTRIHGSGEWFDSVEAYDALEMLPFTSQTSGDTITSELLDTRQSVFNWALGVEQGFGSRYRGFASFGTDRSSQREGIPEDDVLTISGWDIYTVSLGIDIAVGETSLTVGGAYGWGSTPISQIANFPGAGGEPTFEEPGESMLRYRTFRFIIGFEL